MLIHRRGLRPTSLRWHPHFAFFDVFWAGMSAPIAFWLRNPEAFSPSVITSELVTSVLIYTVISVICAPLVFVWVGVGEDLTRYFSGREARGILAASGFAVGLVAVVNFTIMRLDNAPRSVPVLHFMLLAGGLIFGRSLSRMRQKRRDARHWPDVEVEHILIVGASRLASFYVRMLDELAPTSHRPLAIFDEKASMTGRSIAGCPIVGPLAELPRVVSEYKVHGIQIHRIVVTKPLLDLPPLASLILGQMAATGILVQPLDAQLFVERSRAVPQVTFVETPELNAEREVILRRPYWVVKRGMDITMAALLLLVLMPVAILVAVITFFNVGYPVLFWQRRVGRAGRPIMVSKFRTLRAPFDQRGRLLPDDQRLNWIGRTLRATRFDEIPQLLSILTGQMSIIGPRPLLPHDQPNEVGLRLMIPPGLTGWAQINGGTTITVEEKDALDEYYVRHASLWLDLQVLLRTPLMLLVGDRRGERAIRVALAEMKRARPPAGIARSASEAAIGAAE